MRVTLACFLSLVLAGSAIAQGPALPPPVADARMAVFQLRYVSLGLIHSLLRPFDLQMSETPDLNAVSVRAAPATLKVVEDIIRKFDVPANAQKNVELTVYLLLGSSAAEASDVPSGLRPVIDQLLSIMVYKSYRLLDTLVVGRTAEGNVLSSNGIVNKLAASDPWAPLYEFQAKPRVSGEGAEQTVHLDNMVFRINVPARVEGSATSQRLSISTSVDIRKGQQVVVGKATVEDRSLVLVVSAKVIE